MGKEPNAIRPVCFDSVIAHGDRIWPSSQRYGAFWRLGPSWKQCYLTLQVISPCKCLLWGPWRKVRLLRDII
jgi:hypothetical protein